MRVHEELWPSTPVGVQRLFDRHEPTVFRGLASEWLPVRGEARDVLTWLADVVGDRQVPITVVLPSDDGLIGTAAVKRGRRVASGLGGQRPFRNIAAEIAASAQADDSCALYVQSLLVAAELPELLPYLALPLRDVTLPGEWRAWIGSGRHRVALHWDAKENFYCVLGGRKRFSLGPFEVLPDIYVGPLEGNEYGAATSVVDPKTPDLARYPRFARALEQFETVELEAGDVLYLPCNWLHWVESIGINVSVNYWMTDVRPDDRRTAYGAFLRALLATRRAPLHWRTYWRAMFEHFVFQTHGDPYAHLPLEEQGFAGTATVDALKSLHRLIRASDTAMGEGGAETVSTARRYITAATLGMRFAMNGTIVARDVLGNREEALSPLMVTLLSRFVSGHSIVEVLGDLRAAGLAVDDNEVAATVGKLLNAGMLQPCD